MKVYTGQLDPALVAVRYPVGRHANRGIWHLAEVLEPDGGAQYRSVCGTHRRPGVGDAGTSPKVPLGVRREAFVGLAIEFRCQRCLQVLGNLNGRLPSELRRLQVRRRLARGEDISDSYDEWAFDPDGRRW